MKYRIQIQRQVKEFADRLAPEPKRRLRLALRGLESDSGDRMALGERLDGYYRLRVGGLRVICRYLAGGTIDAVFVEERSLVYQLFEREVIERLRRKSTGEGGDPTVEQAAANYGGKRPRRKNRAVPRTA